MGREPGVAETGLPIRRTQFGSCKAMMACDDGGLPGHVAARDGAPQAYSFNLRAHRCQIANVSQRNRSHPTAALRLGGDETFRRQSGQGLADGATADLKYEA